MKQIAIGFLSASIASAILHGAIMGDIGAAIFGFIFSSMFVVILGVPGYIAFRKLGWLKAWQVIIAGFVLGVIAGLILDSVFRIFGAINIKFLCLLGLYGAVAAFFFWLVVLRVKRSNK